MEHTKEPLTAEQTIEQPSEAPILRRSTRSKKHKRKRKLPVGTLLCYLLACTLIAGGVTLSAYVTTTTDSDSARAAKFDVDVQIADTATAMAFNTDGTQAEQETQTYGFTVTSNSEVAVDYAVKLTFQTPPPANMSLQMDDNKAIPCDGVKTEYTFTGLRYNIGEETKEHKLHIIVDYVKDGKLIEVEKFTDTVSVDIIAEQQMSA